MLCSQWVDVFSEAVTYVKTLAAVSDGRIEGCVQGTVCAGRSGDRHTCLPDAGAMKPGRCAGGVGWWEGWGGCALGKQLPLHSHSGTARSSQILMKSCQERRGVLIFLFPKEDNQQGIQQGPERLGLSDHQRKAINLKPSG